MYLIIIIVVLQNNADNSICNKHYLLIHAILSFYFSILRYLEYLLTYHRFFKLL